MTRKEINNIIQNGRLQFNSGFWWDYFMGTIVLTGIFWGIGMIILLKLGFSDDLMIPLLMLIVGLISVKFYLDHKIQKIRTGLTKEQNIELISNTLKQLDWKYKKYTNTIDLEYNKYILKWTYITLIPVDQLIIYTFQYRSTSRAGRFPFFIGIRTYLKRKFEKKLHTTIAKKA